MKDLTVGFLRCDVPNRNGNVYPKEVMEAVVDRLNNRGDVVYGTVGQPEYRGLDIPIDRISHRCENFSIIDGVVTADVFILNTPQGEVLRSIVDCEEPSFRFSCAGKGKLNSKRIIAEFSIDRISCMDLTSVNWE